MCGSAPKAPPPPQPTAQELALMDKQGKAIDAYLGSIEDQKVQNKELGLLTAVSSGLYDPVYENGKLVDAVINQERVGQVKNINSLQADRYEKALKGELPVSEGLLQRKQDDYKLLRENAARRGNEIVGDTLEGAALTPQNSTAGNELVGQLNRTYGLLADQERRGELSMAAPNNLGIALGQQTFGAGSSTAGYGEGVGLLSQGLQPYQSQRGMIAQTNLLNAQNRSAQQAGYYQLGAGLLGLGAGYAAGGAKGKVG